MNYNVTFNSVMDKTAGVHVLKRPSIPSPTPRASVVTVPGRAGDVYIYESTRDISINVDFGWNVSNAVSDYYTATYNFKAWIYSGGNGKLSFSDMPGVFYKVKYVQINEMERLSPKVGKANVTFVCDPFTYITDGETSFDASTIVEGTIVNPWNTTAHPNFYITGSGDCSIAVNGKIFALSIDGSAFINTDKMTVTGQNLAWANPSAIGNYEDLYFMPGDNAFAITSGFQCWITPNWRCL